MSQDGFRVVRVRLLERLCNHYNVLHVTKYPGAVLVVDMHLPNKPAPHTVGKGGSV